MTKNIVLGISGGIAAYKCADLVRRLIERGASVRVVMTESAKEFITPLTMQAVSGTPVADSLLDPAAEASMGHIELAKWADLVLIAPATANTIAKLNAGMADDLLSTLVLATHSPIAIAPAMNQQMYANAATQQNIAALEQRGMMIWGPASGVQACGDVGMGRMLEPMELVAHCENFFLSESSSTAILPIAPSTTATSSTCQPWQGIKLAITAGPTQEALDPVRYLTNKSSGKMGYAIAQAAADLGAQVTLISGPVSLDTPNNATRINVDTAQQMHEASLAHATQNHVFIACAAVADYRPEHVADQKIKKTEDSDQLTITMVKNPDIVADVASLTQNRPFTVGFAAETQEVERYAKDKLARKNLDMICANDVSSECSGFNSANNSLKLFWQENDKIESLNLPEAPKKKLAYPLLEQILKLIN